MKKQLLFIGVFPYCGSLERACFGPGEGQSAAELWLVPQGLWARLEVTFLLAIMELHSSVARVEARRGENKEMTKKYN